MSYEALRIPPRGALTLRQRDQWRGVSLYATKGAAPLRAQLSPQLGSYIAEVRFPDDSSIRIEQGGRDPDHCNAWAEPDVLHGYVVSVEPVEGLH